MQLWQILLLAVLVLLPLTLLHDFWPNRDRLSSRGAPLERDWVPQVTHEPHGEQH